MTVALILNEKGQEVIGIHCDASMADAIKRLSERHIGALLVHSDEDQVAGILSERDIVHGIARHGAGLLKEKVSAFMTKAVITAAPGDSISEVMNIMTERRCRHLPVIDKGQLVGMVSIGDVVKQRIAETEHEAEALKNYIRTG